MKHNMKIYKHNTGKNKYLPYIDTHAFEIGLLTKDIIEDLQILKTSLISAI